MSGRWIAFAVLVVATIAVYLPGIRGPFVFDDISSIVERDNLRSFPPQLRWDLPGSRPLTALTFAANFAISGEHTFGFKLTNLLGHLVCAGLLYAVVLRVSRCYSDLAGVEHSTGDRTPHCLALTTTALWTLHPINSQAVCYIVQRSEILASIGMLGFVYCILRHDASRRWYWQVLGVACVVVGMYAKVHAVMALPVGLCLDIWILRNPLLVCLRRRLLTYPLPLLAGVLTLATYWVSLRTGQSGIGFAGDNAPPLMYLANQSAVIAHYLGLVLLPWTLCIDYRWPIEHHLAPLLAWSMFTGAILVVSSIACRRGNLAGWWMLSALLILAPTSSLIPVTDLAVEHRMYLPSACVIAAMVMVGFQIIASLRWSTQQRSALRFYAALGISGLFVAFGLRTAMRTADYATSYDLWQATAIAAPTNVRALQNWTQAAEQEGRREQLIQGLRLLYETQRIRQQPVGAIASRLSEELMKVGRMSEAKTLIDQAIDQLRDDGWVDERYELSAALLNRSLIHSSITGTGIRADLERAALLKPSNPFPHAMLGQMALRDDQPQVAIEHFQAALQMQPEWPEAILDLAQAQLLVGEFEDAQSTLEKLAPDLPDTQRAQAAALRSLLQQQK